MSTKVGDSDTYENTIMRVLLPPEPWLEKFYLCAGCSELPDHDKRRIGPYERKILNKMLHPILPVVCIVGDIGSGKSTTLAHLNKYHLGQKTLKPDDMTRAHNQHALRKILLGLIDCKDFREEENDIGEKRILHEMVTELRGRIVFLIDDSEEYRDYWEYLLKQYYDNDKCVFDVARHIATSEFDSKEGEVTSELILARKNLVEKLKEDHEWYFRYLILLWKYISRKEKPFRNNVWVTNGIFILDNLDSISPTIQRRVYDLILKCADQTGPTFFLFLRPETFARLGDADNLVDKVEHEGPQPGEIVLDRLERFYNNPGQYLKLEKYLTEEEKQIVISFVERLLPSLRDKKGHFYRFINAASGRSIRIGIVIAQGILLLNRSEMKKVELTPHFLIRECIRQGKTEFERSLKSPFENPFCVYGFGQENNLLKIRILQCLRLANPYEEVRSDQGGQRQNVYVYGKRPAKMLSELRNTFVTFGYDEHAFRAAINQMIRRDCQLIASNGLDVYLENWGDEDELIFLTKIGEGYITELVKSADFVQEVMLDAMPLLRAFSSTDSLIGKMDVLGRFLTEVSELDVHETASAIKRLGYRWYIPKFGGQLVSTQIIQPIYTSVGRILRTAARQQTDIYYLNELMNYFTSIVRNAEYNSREVLRIEVVPVEEISLSKS